MNHRAIATEIPSKVIESIWPRVDAYDYSVKHSPRGSEITIAINLKGVRNEIIGVFTKGDNPEALIEAMKAQLEEIINELNQ